MHLVVQLMQTPPQAQLPLQIMQQPVESSWHPAASSETAARSKNAPPVKNLKVRSTVDWILDDSFNFV
jgi:hypothetical protein